MKNFDELLHTIPEAAKKSRMSESWWNAMIQQKKIRYVKIGNRNFIPDSTLKGVVKVIEPVEK